MEFVKRFILKGKLDADQGMRLAGAVALIVGVLDLFGLWDNLPLKAVSFITLLLLASITLYSVKEKGDILAEKESLRKIVESQGTIEYVSTEHELFRGAIKKLEDNQFDKVRILAPVALWKQSSVKSEWVEALARATTRPSPDEVPRIRELRVIYGLPPEKQMFLDVMKPGLQPLKGKQAALIQYLSPEFTRHMPLPGWGMLIMGTQLVGIAFATHSHQMLVDAATLITQREVVDMTIEWFDEIWAETRSQCIQDARREIDMDTQLERIEDCYNYFEKRGADELTNGVNDKHGMLCPHI